jgi:hypothetical protein
VANEKTESSGQEQTLYCRCAILHTCFFWRTREPYFFAIYTINSFGQDTRYLCQMAKRTDFFLLCFYSIYFLAFYLFTFYCHNYRGYNFHLPDVYSDDYCIQSFIGGLQLFPLCTYIHALFCTYYYFTQYFPNEILWSVFRLSYNTRKRIR